MKLDSAPVTPADLKLLPEIRRLLSALNDPVVSQREIDHLCTKVPVLARRIVAHARARAPLRDITRLDSALGLIGNRGLETVLLQLLEDLTVLKADLEPKR